MTGLTRNVPRSSFCTCANNAEIMTLCSLFNHHRSTAGPGIDIPFNFRGVNLVTSDESTFSLASLVDSSLVRQTATGDFLPRMQFTLWAFVDIGCVSAAGPQLRHISCPFQHVCALIGAWAGPTGPLPRVCV